MGALGQHQKAGHHCHQCRGGRGRQQHVEPEATVHPLTQQAGGQVMAQAIAHQGSTRKAVVGLGRGASARMRWASTSRAALPARARATGPSGASSWSCCSAEG
jgi:hypothetical protein